MKALRSLIIILAVSLCYVTGLPPRLLNKAQAETDSPQSSQQSEQTGDTIQRAQALLELSERQNPDDHALALETAQQALTLWQTTGDNAGIARTYARIADYYTAQSDLPEAKQNYERSLEIWHNLNETHEEASILIALGFIESRKGEWENSITFFNRAQDLIVEKDEPLQMGQIAAGLAYIFNESGLPEIALVKNQIALSYFRQTPETRDDIMAISEIGISYYLSKNYPEALNYLQQALAGVAPNSIDAAFCHHYLGKVYGSTGEYDTALEHLQTALPIYVRVGNPKEAAEVRGLIGQIYQQQGRLDAARQYYQQALATFIKLSDRINQAALYYVLGQLELKNEKYNAAESYLSQAIEVTENVRRVSTSRDLTTAFSATVQERYETYIECLMRKHKIEPTQGLAVRAFETSELSRGRSLAELLQSAETSLVPGLDPQLAEQEKSLRQSLRVKEDYKIEMLSREYKKEELAALDAEMTRLEAAYKEVVETIVARYPSYEHITRPVAWNLRQIQEQVITDDQTVLLEYILGADESYVWAVTRNGITSYTLPARALINQAAQKVYSLLLTRPGVESENELRNELNLASQELSRMVLSPVAAELNKPRVIIVADGALNYIPFQALPAPSGNNELLSDNYEVSNAPSAIILGEFQQEAAQRQPAAKVLAAFGDPVVDTNYTLRKSADGGEQLTAAQASEVEPLQHALRDMEATGDSSNPSVIKSLFYAKRELVNLRNVAGEGETFIASDYDATREQLLKTDLTQYAILHFATHAIFDDKRPAFSGLLLSTVNREGLVQDGYVRLQDVYLLRAPVNLVVLSACQTGIGQDVRGEGLVGLTRGFMYAGATSVLASLWNVDDEATAELMKEFYTNLLQKRMTPAAALRAAQNSIRQKPEWRSPYYWAAFTLQGDYRQVIKSTPAAEAKPINSKTMVGGALLVLLSGGTWWYRRRRLRTAQASE